MTQSADGRLPGRLVSLDVFRGITMAAMVVVNNPGDWGTVYAPLLHAEWHGWTPTDMIFPFFLFIVGVAMTLSRSTMGTWWRILRRGVVIMLLGWLLAAFPRFDLAHLRIPGVLVRIGLCYLVAAWIYRWSNPRQRRDDRQHAWRLVGWATGLTLAYWAALVLVPYPGHVPGDLTPEGNLGAFIDRDVFGTAHLWGRRPWDPEGLLSSVPAVATTLLGIVAGLWLRSDAPGDQRALVLAAGGAAGVAVGLVWDLVLPINKGLWTSSYVWFMAGAAALLLSACYWVIDVRGWRRWTGPFVVLGVNAITLFVLAGLSAKLLGLIKVADAGGRSISLSSHVYRQWYAPLAAPHTASLLYALSYLVVLYVVLWVMYRRRIFLKV